jgi:mono/diheme cytochrome c family protein
MGEAVENSLQYLTPQDTSALIAYLRTVPAKSGDPSAEVNPAPAPVLASNAWAPGGDVGPAGIGRHIFEGACASCHQWNGEGQQTPYAALIGSQAANDPSGANLTQVLIHGVKVHTDRGVGYMPAFGGAYSDQEIAAVSNYVIAHFGGKAGKVTPAMVHKAREM